jgi:hypothetical protein
MSDYHYQKHVKGGETYNEGDIKCHDADVSAGGSSTYTARSIECETTAKIVSTGSSTIVIDRLVAADSVSLTCHSSATLRIKEIRAREVSIDVMSSANLRMESGEIENIKGRVKDSSYGCFGGHRSGRDDVTVETASTWNGASCA